MCRNPAHSGYCSKCYRDLCAREARAGGKSDESSAAAGAGGGGGGAGGSGAENKSGKKPVVVTSERHPPSSPFRVDQHAPSSEVPVAHSPPLPSALAACSVRPTPAAVLSPARVASKKKCGTCSKKVGLTGFTCKCGRVFCGVHRYAEAHGCEFDHKTSERARLAEDNPLVQASKLDRL